MRAISQVISQLTAIKGVFSLVGVDFKVQYRTESNNNHNLRAISTQQVVISNNVFHLLSNSINFTGRVESCLTILKVDPAQLINLNSVDSYRFDCFILIRRMNEINKFIEGPIIQRKLNKHNYTCQLNDFIA